MVLQIHFDDLSEMDIWDRSFILMSSQRLRSGPAGPARRRSPLQGMEDLTWRSCKLRALAGTGSVDGPYVRGGVSMSESKAVRDVESLRKNVTSSAYCDNLLEIYLDLVRSFYGATILTTAACFIFLFSKHWTYKAWVYMDYVIILWLPPIEVNTEEHFTVQVEIYGYLLQGSVIIKRDSK